MNPVTWITEPECFSNSLLYPLLFHNNNSTFHNSQLMFASTEERICSHLNEPPEVRLCKRLFRQPSERASPQHPISVFRGRHLDELHGEAGCRLSDMRRETLECCPTVTHNPNTSHMFWIEKQLSNIPYAHKNASGPQQPVERYVENPHTQCKFTSIMREIQKHHIPPTTRTSSCLKPLIPASKTHTFKQTLCHITNTSLTFAFIHCVFFWAFH